MDNPETTPDPSPPERSVESRTGESLKKPVDISASYAAPGDPPKVRGTSAATNEGTASRKRRFRRGLFLLFSLALAAFILTSWILVRVDSPFGEFSAEPQEIVRAQLRALDRGDLRPAYEMFSARYRGQVSFDAWHELVATHWRMFHAEVVRAETAAPSGPGITLQLYLHGADDKNYRARFTLIRTDGRWWIDDVHWTEEQNAHDFSRT
jgi:uncharacterized protein DUF4864